jgi:hypothetical protein
MYYAIEIVSHLFQDLLEFFWIVLNMDLFYLFIVGEPMSHLRVTI